MSRKAGRAKYFGRKRRPVIGAVHSTIVESLPPPGPRRDRESAFRFIETAWPICGISILPRYQDLVCSGNQLD